MKQRWLDRRIARPGPYMVLCFSDAEFRASIAHLKAPSIPAWMNAGADAMTHFFEHERRGTVAVICLGAGWCKRKSIEVAGLLVHEAVHVWQQYCVDIGESRPGDEQEAYAIQSIAQELMSEFVRRMDRGTQ